MFRTIIIQDFLRIFVGVSLFTQQLLEWWVDTFVIIALMRSIIENSCKQDRKETLAFTDLFITPLKS